MNACLPIQAFVMCARYERAIAAHALEELIRVALSEGAADVSPQAEVSPTNPALIVGDFGEGLRIMPAKWGLTTTIKGVPKTVFNARVESLDTSPLWRGIKQCWMPATGWFEWQTLDGWKARQKKPKYRLAPSSGEPFLLRAVARHEAGSWRCAFIMQEAPAHILPIHDRAPFPYPLSAVRDASLPSLLGRCTASRLTPGDAPPEALEASDDAIAEALRALAS